MMRDISIENVPQKNAFSSLKVLSADWKTKVRKQKVFCPNCGRNANSDKWWTQAQIEHAKQAALAEIAGTIEQQRIKN